MSWNMISNIVICVFLGFKMFMATFSGSMIPLAGSKSARIRRKIVLGSKTLATDLVALLYCRVLVMIVLYLNHRGPLIVVSYS